METSECSRISSRMSGHLPLFSSILFSNSSYSSSGVPPSLTSFTFMPLTHFSHFCSIVLTFSFQCSSQHWKEKAFGFPCSAPPLSPAISIYPPPMLTHHCCIFSCLIPLSSIHCSPASTAPLLVIPPMMPGETSCQSSLLLTPFLNQLSNIKRSLHSSSSLLAPNGPPRGRCTRANTHTHTV